MRSTYDNKVGRNEKKNTQQTNKQINQLNHNYANHWQFFVLNFLDLCVISGVNQFNHDFEQIICIAY